MKKLFLIGTGALLIGMCLGYQNETQIDRMMKNSHRMKKKMCKKYNHMMDQLNDCMFCE